MVALLLDFSWQIFLVFSLAQANKSLKHVHPLQLAGVIVWVCSGNTAHINKSMFSKVGPENRYSSFWCVKVGQTSCTVRKIIKHDHHVKTILVLVFTRISAVPD